MSLDEGANNFIYLFIMKNYLLLFCLLLGVASCSKSIRVSYSTYNSDSVQHFDLNHCLDNDFYDVSDVLDSVSFIFLETNPNSLLGNIRRVLVTNDRIFIRDDYQRTGVAVFDNGGHYIKRLTKGNGPGEINVVNDIQYDRYKEELLILSPKLLMKFDKDGNYKETIQLDFPCGSIIGCTENSYVFSKVFDDHSDKPVFDNYSLIVSNKNLEPTQLLLPYSKVSAIMMTNNSGLDFESNIIVRQSFSDSIFILKNDSLFTYKTIDISSKKFDLNQFDSFEDFMDNAYKQDNSNGIMFDGHYYENSTHIIFGMVSKSTLFPIYINKSNLHSVYGLNCRIDIDCGVPIGVPKGIYNDYFFELVCPFAYNYDAITSNKYISAHDLEILKHVKEEDNPFIMFYKLKDF